jgi:hypothetical protein
MIEDRIARLPVWAQTYISTLERRAVEAEARLVGVLGGTPTTASVYRLTKARVNEPISPGYPGDDNPTIQFTPTPTIERIPPGWLQARVENKADGPWLAVYGEHVLTVRIQASNWLYIGMGR